MRSQLGIIVLAALATVIAAWTALAWSRIPGSDRWFFAAIGAGMLAPCTYELARRLRRRRAAREASLPARAQVIRRR